MQENVAQQFAIALEAPHRLLYLGREYIKFALFVCPRPLQDVYATLRSIPPQIRVQFVVRGISAPTRKRNPKKQPRMT